MTQPEADHIPESDDIEALAERAIARVDDER
jgi:hypothetical protein